MRYDAHEIFRFGMVSAGSGVVNCVEQVAPDGRERCAKHREHEATTSIARYNRDFVNTMFSHKAESGLALQGTAVYATSTEAAVRCWAQAQHLQLRLSDQQRHTLSHGLIQPHARLPDPQAQANCKQRRLWIGLGPPRTQDSTVASRSQAPQATSAPAWMCDRAHD
eukprot:2754095-Rhodomonas_salina.3